MSPLAIIAAQSVFLIAGVEAPARGCTKDPSSVVLTSVHLQENDRVKAVVKLSSDYGVCLGIRTDAQTHPVLINGSKQRLVHVIKQAFPGYDVYVQPSIIIVRARSRAPWLDYRLNKFSVNSAPLSFNSAQLFWAIEYQENPNLGGTAGSILSSIDEGVVGPFTASNSSVFQLLNALIVKSSKGGGWIVKETAAEREAPPSDSPFWKIVSYDR